MRVIALLATYNEQRFIANCIEHLWRNGVETYLIDNDSTDRTLESAERYRGRGLVGTERLPRDGYSRLRERCERKEVLALELDADWFVHLDADEIRLPPSPRQTLREAFEEVERQGCNAVDFQEFVFVPTRESPDHDHAGYPETMRWYYPFLPWSPHRLNAWKRQPARVDLAWSAGHQVRFPGLTMYPRPFPMRHYMYLSVAHAIRKYVPLRYDPQAVERGWHGKRVALRAEDIGLASAADLRVFGGDAVLDASQPRVEHVLFQGRRGHRGHRGV